jgi:hypothetical protein
MTKLYLGNIKDIVDRLGIMNGRNQPECYTKRPELSDRLVRVAIFDTGCNLEADGVKDYVRQPSEAPPVGPGVVGWKDFVDDGLCEVKFQDDPQDDHGTQMVTEFLKVMPLARIYIARVLRQKASKGEDEPRRDVDGSGVDLRAERIVKVSFNGSSPRIKYSHSRAHGKFDVQDIYLLRPSIYQKDRKERGQEQA